jgi:uncharacterized protein (DUF1684 family)
MSAAIAAEPLDEAAWQAWVSKGRVQKRRSDAATTKAVNWISIAGLLVAATLLSQLAPYAVIIRFIVAAGATVVMFQSFHARHSSFSGDWPCAMVAASAIPFVATLTGLKNKERRSVQT